MRVYREKPRKAEKQTTNRIKSKERDYIIHTPGCWCEDAVCYTSIDIAYFKYICETPRSFRSEFPVNFDTSKSINSHNKKNIKCEKEQPAVATKAHSIKSHQYFILRFDSMNRIQRTKWHTLAPKYCFVCLFVCLLESRIRWIVHRIAEKNCVFILNVYTELIMMLHIRNKKGHLMSWLSHSLNTIKSTSA